MNILIIDESQIALKTIGDFLGDQGHSVQCLESKADLAHDPRETIDPVDLVLIDTGAPKGQESRIIEEIHILFPSAYIVIMSFDDATLPTDYAVSQGVFAYLHKPPHLFELELLVTRIGERLEN